MSRPVKPIKFLFAIRKKRPAFREIALHKYAARLLTIQQFNLQCVIWSLLGNPQKSLQLRLAGV